MRKRAIIGGLVLALSAGLGVPAAAQNLSKLRKLADKCNKDDQKACRQLEGLTAGIDGPGLPLEIIQRLTNQRTLAHIATNAYRDGIRIAALDRITDQAALADVARTTAFRVQDLAVRKLTDQAVLAEIAQGGAPLSVRQEAILRLDDQAALKAIALKRDEDSDLRRAAVSRLTDQALLAWMARQRDDVALQTPAVRRLTDQALLAEIALDKTENTYLRCDAVRGITDLALLTKIAREAWSMNVRGVAEDKLVADVKTQDRTEAELLGIAVSHYVPAVRKAAEARLLEMLPIGDQERLASVALSHGLISAREVAATRLTDQALLAQVALKADVLSIRKAAFLKLTDTSGLERLAGQQANAGLALAAEIRLGRTSWEALVGRTPSEDAERLIAAMALFDRQEALTRTATQVCHGYIGRGNPDRIPDLVELLFTYGDVSLAEDFVNCGEPTLEDAARRWAAQHGYRIVGGSGSHRKRWGADRSK